MAPLFMETLTFTAAARGVTQLHKNLSNNSVEARIDIPKIAQGCGQFLVYTMRSSRCREFMLLIQILRDEL